MAYRLHAARLSDPDARLPHHAIDDRPGIVDTPPESTYTLGRFADPLHESLCRSATCYQNNVYSAVRIAITPTLPTLNAYGVR